MKSDAAIALKMIDFYRGNVEDINHFLKVRAFAEAIGEAEGLDEKTMRCLAVAATVHDIACPLCREKYHSTNGKLQEKESPALLDDFLAEFDLPKNVFDRVVYVVSRHHTYENVDGADWQILLEADFLVNADENAVSADAIRAMLHSAYQTEMGKRLLRSIYQHKLG